MDDDMNDNQEITAQEREQMQRFMSHRARFQEKRKWAGFCRWMAGRYGRPSTADKPDKPPVSLRERN